MSRDLQVIKRELDQLKAQLGAAQIRHNEVMGALQSTYGIKTAKEAAYEQAELANNIIPKLEADRDSLIKQAEEVLDGITENNTGGHPGAQAGPAGAGNRTGPAQSRTLVGSQR